MWTAPRDLPTSCEPTAKRLESLGIRRRWGLGEPRPIVYKEVMLAPLRGEF